MHWEIITYNNITAGVNKLLIMRCLWGSSVPASGVPWSCSSIWPPAAWHRSCSV